MVAFHPTTYNVLIEEMSCNEDMNQYNTCFIWFYSLLLYLLQPKASPSYRSAYADHPEEGPSGTDFQPIGQATTFGYLAEETAEEGV